MEFAEDRRHVVACDQPHGCGAAFRWLTRGVLVHHLERSPEQTAGLIDLIDLELHGPFHLLPTRKVAGGRQGPNPAEHDRLGGESACGQERGRRERGKDAHALHSFLPPVGAGKNYSRWHLCLMKQIFDDDVKWNIYCGAEIEPVICRARPTDCGAACAAPERTTMTHVLHRSIAHRYPTAVSGRGIFIRDETGKDYIDASGGAAVSCLGHSHPDVLAAMRAQLDKLEYRIRASSRPGSRGTRRRPRGARAGRGSTTSSTSAAGRRRSRPRSSWRGSISSSAASRSAAI